ncbi:hypothetical protein D9757_001746 [Collybiopsis confluens]|uniref:Uncharacterized protein n=1 Tax=Collybiopsis confluens TaxID=2823264 RepID=A0A8H5MFF1_9AGAR|nr:hypothetical protein D9757_001746 [Collybiopsis confluens]
MTLQCQFCNISLDKISVSERQRHYNNHLDASERSKNSTDSPSALKSSVAKGKFRLPTRSNLEKGKDVFWYCSINTPPPPNYTPGLIPVLKRALLKSHAKGTTTRAVLCYERTVHICRQAWDATWGCGYRNFLMCCAALMDQPYQPTYFPLLDQPIPPGIRNLQSWIEEAWNNGFDPEGHAELKKLVNTRKWIGTSDLCAAFSSRGIPVELVDFEVKDKGILPLTNWIVSYFDKYSKLNSAASTVNAALSGASPVVCAPCMPLILQNAGHSRTVVGYELNKSGGINLLAFDPSQLPTKTMRDAAWSAFSSSTLSSSSSVVRGNKRPGRINTSHHGKRVKTNHPNNDESNTAWTDKDDEIKIVGERIRIGSDDIELIGEAGHDMNESTSKVDKSLDEPAYVDMLKHFRWEHRFFKKRNNYQILYFTLEESLSDEQKAQRKILTKQPQGVTLTSKECHSQGIKYPTFRQLNKKSRIHLSPQYLSTDQNYVYRNLVVSNKQGWFAAIQYTAGNFSAILSPLDELRQSIKEASTDDSSLTPQRILSFSTSEPNILSLACNETRLIVGFKSGHLIVYDTSSVFTSGTNEIQPAHVLQSSRQPIIDIAPNPSTEDMSLANLLAVVRVDGTVQLLSTNMEPQGGWVASDVDSTPVAVAWSPKGKQLAIGLRRGDILTFTLENKTQHQKHIPPTADGLLTSLDWLSLGHTFRTTYTAPDPVHHIVVFDKRNSAITFTRLEHAFQVPDRIRKDSYAAVLPNWDDDSDDRLLIIVGDVSCTDLDIIGNIGNEWYQQSQENPLTIPLDKESEDTVLLSLQVDFTEIGDTEHQCPIIYAYLNDGTIQGWYLDHPEKISYKGMIGRQNSTTAASSAFSQSLQAPPSFGARPALNQSPSFGSLSGPAQATATTPAFGKPSFGQSGFGASAAANTSGGFASFASNSASPFGAGGFGSSSFGGTSAPETPSQITRDASMGDSTPSFGALSIGGGSDENSKPKPAFGGASGMFGSPTPLPLPPDHPANQTPPSQPSAFGSGGGSFIKPAAGFGAFSGSNSGSFSTFGNNAETGTSPFGGGAFSAKPQQSSAFPSNAVKSGSGFGQSLFGKPSFGQPAFGQSSFETKVAANTAGELGAFSSSVPTAFGNATPPTPDTTGGFLSFAQSPSTFSAAASSGRSALTTKKEDSGSEASASPFGKLLGDKPASPFGGQPNTPMAGGAFSNFASTGPSVFGQPALNSENSSPSPFEQPALTSSTFGAVKSETPGPFSQFTSSSSGSAFGGLKSESPSVFGQPTSAVSGSVFGSALDNASGASVSVAVESEPKDTPIKSEPSSPTLFSSSAVPTTPKVISEAAPPSGGSFKNLQSSNSVFKPASGFGAFGSALLNSSPFLKASTNTAAKPVVSAFGDLSTSKPTAPISTSASSGPTFGSTSQLGFGFGIKKAEPTSSPAVLSENNAITSNAFSAFSGTHSPFSVAGGVTKSFGDLLKGGKDRSLEAQLTPSESDAKISPQSSPNQQTEKGGADESKPLPKSKEKKRERTLENIPLKMNENEEGSAEEEEEVPDSDGGFEDHLEAHGDDDGDFLSESYVSEEDEEQQSEEGEVKEEEEEEKEGEEDDSPLSSPDPTEIPLPPSRSRSNTPRPETPKEGSAPSTPSDESECRLSTIREESTTPPGSPVKSQTLNPSAIAAPAPINLPSLTLGVGRPSTRPTRSSPLASKPLMGSDDEKQEEAEAEAEPTPTVSPRNLGLHLQRSLDTPSTPRPAAATLPFTTPSKPPLSAPVIAPPITPLFSLPIPSTSVFGKPFSLQPARIESAPPKVFSPPSPSLFGSTSSPSSFIPTPASSSSSPPGGFMRPSPTGPPIENGMQRECYILVEAIQKELEHLRALATVVAKKREQYLMSVGGSRRKEEIGYPEKWRISDSKQFGVVLRQFEQDISELKESTDKQKEEIRDLSKSMIKAGTRKEEIARFNSAKSDNEFSKMLKFRTLGPEHLENQTQLRRNIRALRTKVDQLEDQLRAHKKRFNEVSSGRPALKPPSLDTIHRTYRNIDIALQQQTDEVEQLNTRLMKLNLSAPPRGDPGTRDPRLPTFTPHSRPSIITPDVAVTTAAALNAERSAQKLKTMLLKARKEPLLNVKAKEFVEGGKAILTAYSTLKVAAESPAFGLSTGLQFGTPIIEGPLFGTSSPSIAQSRGWDDLSFPEDNFNPSTPLSSGAEEGVHRRESMHRLL